MSNDKGFKPRLKLMELIKVTVSKFKPKGLNDEKDC